MRLTALVLACLASAGGAYQLNVGRSATPALARADTVVAKAALGRAINAGLAFSTAATFFSASTFAEEAPKAAEPEAAAAAPAPAPKMAAAKKPKGREDAKSPDKYTGGYTDKKFKKVYDQNKVKLPKPLPVIDKKMAGKPGFNERGEPSSPGAAEALRADQERAAKKAASASKAQALAEEQQARIAAARIAKAEALERKEIEGAANLSAYLDKANAKKSAEQAERGADLEGRLKNVADRYDLSKAARASKDEANARLAKKQAQYEAANAAKEGKPKLINPVEPIANPAAYPVVQPAKLPAAVIEAAPEPVAAAAPEPVAAD